MTIAATEESIDGARHLVLAAFASAHAKRRDGWQVMRLAVLNNRLLQMTDRSFAPASYGFGSLLELIAALSDIVVVQGDGRDASVRLLPPAADSIAAAQPSSQVAPRDLRVREDLFRAVIDYSSGIAYAWDGERVRTDVEAPASSRLPTMTAAEMRDLKGAFADSVRAGADASQFAHARAWADRELPTRSLPGPMQGEWNGFLKQAVIERLETWFEASGLERPADLLLVRSAPRAADNPTKDLRSFVMRVVSQMTADELGQLALPARAVYRADRHGG